MATSILYKYAQFLSQSTDAQFDTLHEPGAATPASGIYRCEGCGKEITEVRAHHFLLKTTINTSRRRAGFGGA